MSNLKTRSFLLLAAFKQLKPKLLAYSSQSERWLPIEDVQRELKAQGKVGKYDRKAKGFTKKLSSDDHIK